MNIFYSLSAVITLILLATVGVFVLHWQSLFAIVIPYIAFAIFIVGFIYRVLKWASAPVPFHIPTICGQQKSLPWIKQGRLESPSSRLGVFGRMALEVLSSGHSFVMTVRN